MSKNKHTGTFYYAEEAERRFKLLYHVNIVTFAVTFIYTFLFAINKVYLSVAVNLFCAIGFLVSAIVLMRGASMETVSKFYGPLGGLNIYFNIFYTGGLLAPGLPWLAAQPIVVLLVAGKKQGYIWMVLDFCALVTIYVLQEMHFPFPKTVAALSDTNQNIFSSMAGIVLLVFGVALIFENSKNAAFDKLTSKNEIINQEKEKSDNLLRNILPGQVIKELREKGYSEAKLFEQVTVMFADVKDFTQFCEIFTPKQLLEELDICFRKFDEIVEKYGLEKIKTIGDAYLCAGGLPLPGKDCASKMVNAALEMRNFMLQLKSERLASGIPCFEIRIGLHTGPVIAGIVGMKKFAYDIWGDTVNMAERMEEAGECGKINISEITCQLIQHRFRCTYRENWKPNTKEE